jgi:aryl-alcohol dehydrogenase-like predicted oxidoreductase
MKYAVLGRTGVRVSQVCLGTAFRGQWDDKVCARLIEHALELDINFIDTSNVYGENRVGQAERLIGEVLGRDRHRVILTTKLFHPVGEGQNDRGLSRVHVFRELEQSLKRLRTDFVDVLFLHEPDPDTPLEEILRTMDAVIREGKARYVGLSRFPAWQACKALWISEQRRYEPVSVLQYRYNLIHREAEMEIFPFIRDCGLGLMIYSPLAIGLLSGRFRRNQAPPADSPWGQGYRGFDELMTPQTDRIVEELDLIARNHQTSSGPVALAWVLSHREVTSVIIGPDHLDQLEQNATATSLELTPDELALLEQTSNPEWMRRR